MTINAYISRVLKHFKQYMIRAHESKIYMHLTDILPIQQVLSESFKYYARYLDSNSKC